jgi:hypothetical protein
VININSQVIEELMNHFGRTGAKQRPRIRKFHAELLVSKYLLREKVIASSEIDRPKEYIDRVVKYSKGFIEYANEGEGELFLTELFFETLGRWHRQYSEIEELDHSEENLIDQGIIATEENITFDKRLIYSRFHKLVSDEGEAMNDPVHWLFNDENIDLCNYIDFGQKNSPAFSSNLFLLKFYVLRKIDEVAFVTSRFVHCPACSANYVIPATKIDFLATYKCENRIGDKTCKTTLKKFPARKMIPTYIYEIGVEVKGKDTIEMKEFFLESFTELNTGFYTGMCFGRTEAKKNSFYFLCLVAKEEKARNPFTYIEEGEGHNFFKLINSIYKHINSVGFIIDEEKAGLPFIIETIKKLNVTFNKEINLDHSLYYGAPGIGKTYSLTLLHHFFYSSSGFISGPRFTLPGLTGGQREVTYQDVSRKKNVPGLFSNSAFIFDEINNAQFLSDDKAVNLFKSVALVPSGTSSTVGGKEFSRIALIAGTANYDVETLRHYENKIKKIYARETKAQIKPAEMNEQNTFLSNIFEQQQQDIDSQLPTDFDFYAPLKDFKPDCPKALKMAVLKVRDDSKNFLTNFPKPLMERFYFSVLVHPKYDKSFLKQKKINVLDHLQSRNSQYGQRELIAQLYAPDLDVKLFEMTEEARKKFQNPEVEKKWSKQAQEFLSLLADKYLEFFSMFHRINQVHVFTLYSLSILNNETELSFATKRIFERIISLLHTTIDINDFHTPDFENYQFLGERRGELLSIIKRYEGKDIQHLVDFERQNVKTIVLNLENERKIKKLDKGFYLLDNSKKELEV